ncbi:hypothetical protein, partial [Xanthomonas oryzae]|uniref:hypothetical protein n=4 Tax=Xanthomonas oryzae TaxID=347 RepID=UPI001C4A1EF6
MVNAAIAAGDARVGFASKSHATDRPKPHARPDGAQRCAVRAISTPVEIATIGPRAKNLFTILFKPCKL